MKVNKKILMAALLIGAVSCASKNAVGVDQQQNVKYKEINQQQNVKYKEINQQQQLANIRNEILECNFTGIDPDIFVMTIARAKIGSLTNKLTQNKIIDDKLISAFQKAIVDSPVIDKIALDSSKIDINMLNDQINAVHLSIRYNFKDIVNIIDSGEYNELGIIASFDIALNLFKDSLVKLIGEDKDNKYTALSNKIQKLGSAIDEIRTDMSIKMFQNQSQDAAELSETLKELHKNDNITVFGDDHQSILLLFDSLNRGYDNIIKSIIRQDSTKLLSQIERLTKNLSYIQEISETHKESLNDRKESDKELMSSEIRCYAMLRRISSAMSSHAKSLKQLENEIRYGAIIKYIKYVI